ISARPAELRSACVALDRGTSQSLIALPIQNSSNFGAEKSAGFFTSRNEISAWASEPASKRKRCGKA
ncbi:MAG: hypothetical protein V1839_00575, partial [archaeon]